MGLTVSQSPYSACAHMSRPFHGPDCFTVSTCCTNIDLGSRGYYRRSCCTSKCEYECLYHMYIYIYIYMYIYEKMTCLLMFLRISSKYHRLQTPEFSVICKYDIMGKKVFIVFLYFTYIVMPHYWLILYFRLPYYHGPNSLYIILCYFRFA